MPRGTAGAPGGAAAPALPCGATDPRGSCCARCVQLSTHDEGSCWVPALLRPAIVLSHFGRTELDHVSTTGYGPDNYSVTTHHPVYQPEGFPGDKLGRFACFDPAKDLVRVLGLLFFFFYYGRAAWIGEITLLTCLHDTIGPLVRNAAASFPLS